LELHLHAAHATALADLKNCPSPERLVANGGPFDKAHRRALCLILRCVPPAIIKAEMVSVREGIPDGVKTLLGRVLSKLDDVHPISIGVLRSMVELGTRKPDGGTVPGAGDALDELQTLLLDRLRASAKENGLLQQRQPITLLLHWKDLQRDEPRAWTAAQIETDAGALALGKASIQTGRSQSEGDRVASEYLSVSRKALADILDVDRLEARLAEVAGRADPEGQRVLDRFREGLKARDW
jgi:hypothetical protein